MAESDEEILAGGIANAGRVVRVGDEVLRPPGEHRVLVHAFLDHLRARRFDGAPRPIGMASDGRERLEYIPGDVGIPPYPEWARSDDLLASAARLLRRLHDAGADFEPPPGATWNTELADPSAASSTATATGAGIGGSDGVVWCHNDVCLENVVARRGVAVAFVDFEYLAPGRRVVDLAALARMCCPVDAPENSARLGWEPVDVAERLVVVADAYGLTHGRAALVDEIQRVVDDGGAFVRRRMAAGDEAFIRMFEDMGGEERFERRAAWFAVNADRFREQLG